MPTPRQRTARRAHAAYVVSTAEQRDLWDLPDLAVSGLAVPVDEACALDLLYDAAAKPEMAPALFPGRSPEAVAGVERCRAHCLVLRRAP